MITRASSMASEEAPRSVIHSRRDCRATETEDGVNGRHSVMGAETLLVTTYLADCSTSRFVD
jgi:hypothetical protein